MGAAAGDAASHSRPEIVMVQPGCQGNLMLQFYNYLRPHLVLVEAPAVCLWPLGVMWPQRCVGVVITEKCSMYNRYRFVFFCAAVAQASLSVSRIEGARGTYTQASPRGDCQLSR